MRFLRLRYEFVGFSGWKPQPMRGSPRWTSGRDAVVDLLRLAALLAVHRLHRDPKDARCRRGMDVLPRLERLAQRLILTHRRKNAELNLDVVGRQELPSLPRDERFADPPPLLRANGDVLQVRVRRRRSEERR